MWQCSSGRSGHPNLERPDREILELSLVQWRRAPKLMQAHAALIERRANAHQLALVVAGDSTRPVATRLNAGASVAAAGLAARLLARRDRGAWTATGEIRIPRGG